MASAVARDYLCVEPYSLPIPSHVSWMSFEAQARDLANDVLDAKSRFLLRRCTYGKVVEIYTIVIGQIDAWIATVADKQAISPTLDKGLLHGYLQFQGHRAAFAMNKVEIEHQRRTAM